MKRIRRVAIIVCVLAIIVFIVITVRKASKSEEAASPPELNEAPIAIYGTLEPIGKAISVSPKASGIVREIYVQEGDTIQRGQPLCVLENTIQSGNLNRETVTSPRSGLVYKCDLRIGEAFNIGDRERLVLGSPDLQICCDLEVLWIGRIEKQKAYDVFNAENEELIGTATFRSASRYLRPKSVRTEEPGERASTQYQEVIMDFKPSKPDLPTGLPVMLRIREER